MITNRQLEEFKKELVTIIDIYKQEFSEQKPTDYKTYETQWANRLRTALKEVKNVIDQADNSIRIRPKHFGRSKSKSQAKSPHPKRQRPCTVQQPQDGKSSTALLTL
jgi:sugar-specific transcriptional regulator TrmB